MSDATAAALAALNQTIKDLALAIRELRKALEREEGPNDG